MLQINCIQYELAYLTSNVSEAGAYPQKNIQKQLKPLIWTLGFLSIEILVKAMYFLGLKLINKILFYVILTIFIFSFSFY